MTTESTPPAESPEPTENAGETTAEATPEAVETEDGTDVDSSDETTDDDSSDDSAGDSTTAKLRREAGKYRQRARAAETSLAEAEQRIEGLQRALLEPLVKDAGLSVKALEATVAALADMFDSDGKPDRAAINTAAASAQSELGLQRFGGSADGGVRNDSPVRSLSWAEALRAQLGG